LSDPPAVHPFPTRRSSDLGLLSATAPVMAHHSFAAEYDRSKPIKFTGTVTKVEWMNPHIYYYVDVKDQSGKITNYAVEGGTPNRDRKSTRLNSSHEWISYA